MKLLVSLLLFFLTVDSCWSSYDCERANWWDSFQSEGWSTCPSKRYIVGFYRSANSGGKDYISRLEEAKCCKAPRPNDNSWSTCQKIYFWAKFERNWSEVKCPEGYFLQDLYRSNGNHRGYLSNIEEAQCCKPTDLPSEASCKWKSIGTSFDSQGLSECDYGYYMAGFKRGGCNELYCLEKLWCCKMHERCASNPCSNGASCVETQGSYRCDLDGGWSSWNEWKVCDSVHVCGDGSGTQSRSRSCTNPPRQGKGQYCRGYNSHETRSCISCQVGYDLQKRGEKVASPALPFSGNMCLYFRYRTYGRANVGKLLKVIVNKQTWSTKRWHKGNRWLPAAVYINLSGKYSVTFDGIGPFRIKDFLLVSGYC